jgi:hypothetical protein
VVFVQNNEAEGTTTTKTKGESTLQVDGTTPGWTSLRVQWRINRLAKKTKKSERLAGSIEACQRLVNEGRRTLHSAYSHPRLASSEVDDSIMGRGEPEISCLRYGV